MDTEFDPNMKILQWNMHRRKLEIYFKYKYLDSKDPPDIIRTTVILASRRILKRSSLSAMDKSTKLQRR